MQQMMPLLTWNCPQLLAVDQTAANHQSACLLWERAITWSLGSDSWRHLTIMSMASRQPKAWGSAQPLAPLGPITCRPAACSATCQSTSFMQGPGGTCGARAAASCASKAAVALVERAATLLTRKGQT